MPDRPRGIGLGVHGDRPLPSPGVTTRCTVAKTVTGPDGWKYEDVSVNVWAGYSPTEAADERYKRRREANPKSARRLSPTEVEITTSLPDGYTEVAVLTFDLLPEPGRPAGTATGGTNA